MYFQQRTIETGTRFEFNPLAYVKAIKSFQNCKYLVNTG